MKITALVLLAGITCGAQQPASTQDARTEKHPYVFDVVSIHPAAGAIFRMRIAPDGFETYALPLGVVLGSAFFRPIGSSRDWLIGAPDWVWSEKYDFVAKVSAEDQPEWSKRYEGLTMMGDNSRLLEMMHPMLQAAMADRCKLVTHRITSETPGYALMLVRKEPNLKALKPAPDNEEIPSTALRITDGARMIPIMNKEDPVLTFYRTSMAALGNQLQGGRGTPVVDRTGLTGKYDFKLLRLNAEEIDSNWDLAALGLKLVPIKVPVDKVVIDHIEKPTPN
jgi:uncharacterized protein (TIGR03435 family)